MTTGEDLERLRAALARNHKCYTGKGPERVTVHLSGTVLTVVLEGFLTPFERGVLKDRANLETVLALRNSMLRSSIPDWNELLLPLGLRVTKIDGDLDCETERRVILARVEKLI